MLGTAMRISLVEAFSFSGELEEGDADAGVQAKEQKFMVFTARMWRIQGCLRGEGGVSTGRMELSDSSSSSDSFQTTSLLSLPWLHGGVRNRTER